jgi:hypothetical protein
MRSVPGFHCARATKPQRLSKNVALFQHGFSTQNNREVTKKTPLFQQKSCDPYQASLHAYNKAAVAFEKHGFISARMCFFFHPLPGGTKAHAPVLRARSEEK